MRFGRLLVTGIAPKVGRYPKLLCRCDCGSEKAIRRSPLLSGDSTSCGCAVKEREHGSTALDLVGYRSGRLTAVSRLRVCERTRCAVWSCVCDCGTKFEALSSRIHTGLVTSCGCAKKDKPKLGAQKWRDQSITKQSTRRARERNAAGSFTPEQITELYLKQRGRCANCGCALGDDFHRDHRVALANGGDNNITNIELLCGQCNQRKHAKDPVRWAQENGRLL